MDSELHLGAKCGSHSADDDVLAEESQMKDEIDTRSCVQIDEDAKKPALAATVDELKQMLNVIEKDILVETEKGVANGNKVFGAAILNADLTCSVAATNKETDCPLFHGEIKCIFDWSVQTPASERGSIAQSSVFLSTHEPCCMCISSILWTGFQRVFYWLPYETTTAQGIPHDVNTMHELWGVSSYRRQNKYLATACVQDLIEALGDDDDDKAALKEQSRNLLCRYDELSRKYHKEKSGNKENSLVLD